MEKILETVKLLQKAQIKIGNTLRSQGEEIDYIKALITIQGKKIKHNLEMLNIKNRYT